MGDHRCTAEQVGAGIASRAVSRDAASLQSPARAN
jgi:hypothetical protein